MIAPGFLDCYAHPASRWSGIDREMYPEPTDGLLALRQFLILRRAADEDDALRDRLPTSPGRP